MDFLTISNELNFAFSQIRHAEISILAKIASNFGGKIQIWLKSVFNMWLLKTFYLCPLQNFKVSQLQNDGFLIFSNVQYFTFSLIRQAEMSILVKIAHNFGGKIQILY